MKTKSIYGLWVAMALLIFTSCANLTVKKRHYRPGYYISLSGKKHATKPGHDVVEDESSSILAKANSLPNEEITDQLISKDRAQSKTSDALPTSDIAEVSKSDVAPIQSRPQSLSSVNAVKENINSHRIKLTQNVKSSAKSHASPARVDGDGHSLLWLVVLIILILWLIAFLSGGWGLGGFIHLLLVVAIILFILWILGII